MSIIKVTNKLLVIGIQICEVDATTGIITLRMSPDREAIASTISIIQAAYKDAPGLVSETFMTVIIIDISDNPPAFESNIYRKLISKRDIPKGTKLLRVQATAPDFEEKGKVVYSIATNKAGGTNAELLFQIDSNSEEISRSQSEFAYNGDFLIFHVWASDSGSPAKSSDVLVNFTISLNNAPPFFPLDEYVFTLDENTEKDVVVGEIKANNTDTGLKGQIEYSFFNVLRGDRILNVALTLTSIPDHEKHPSHVLEFRASDKGSPPLSASVIVTVEINDLNDNAPVFIDFSPIVTVDEHTGENHFIRNVNATDADSAENGNITYTIKESFQDGENALKVMALDAVTGVLTTKKNIRFKEFPFFKIKVIATDGGTPPKSTDAFFIVDIIDVNEPPYFQPNETTIPITENTPIGVLVGSIKARDIDKFGNGELVYTFNETISGSMFQL